MIRLHDGPSTTAVASWLRQEPEDHFGLDPEDERAEALASDLTGWWRGPRLDGPQAGLSPSGPLKDTASAAGDGASLRAGAWQPSESEWRYRSVPLTLGRLFGRGMATSLCVAAPAPFPSSTTHCPHGKPVSHSQ